MKVSYRKGDLSCTEQAQLQLIPCVSIVPLTKISSGGLDENGPHRLILLTVWSQLVVLGED